jgi:DHA1 family tetracycline resistance protein-like MFS transporter
MSMPAAQSMMTHRVSEREQGELQGAIGSLRSITFIIGPILFSRVFGWFIDPKHSFQVPGAPYYLGAALLFTAMLMATRIEQPQMGATSTTAPEAPTVVAPEDVAAGAVAPMVDPPGQEPT